MVQPIKIRLPDFPLWEYDTDSISTWFDPCCTPSRVDSIHVIKGDGQADLAKQGYIDND